MNPHLPTRSQVWQEAKSFMTDSFGKFYFRQEQEEPHHPAQKVKMVSEKENITTLKNVCLEFENTGTENPVLEIKLQVQKQVLGIDL